MKLAFLDFFLKRYSNEGHETRKRIEALVTVQAMLAFATLLASLIIDPGPSKVLTFVSFVLLLLLLFLTWAGKAETMSVVTGIFVSAAFVSIPLAATYKMTYELYMIAALACTSTVVTYYIARKKWQGLTSLAIALASIAFRYFSKVLPSQLAAGLPSAADDFAISVLCVLLTAYLSHRSMSRSAVLLKTAEAESERNLRQVVTLRKAIDAVQENMNLGSALVRSASSMDGELDCMRQEVSRAHSSLEGLTARAVELDSAMVAVSSLAKRATEGAESQSAVVNEVSAAVVEMTESIRNVARITSERRESIQRLTEAMDSGMREMGKSSESVKGMEEKTASILDIVKVINAVAARTNLLAMNAAIEAAHAGEYGRGFSVVADEIRKLSEQTGRNVKAASQSIKETIQAMRSVSEANERTRTSFGKMSTEASSVSHAMEEISRGMSEMSAGTEEIMHGIGSSVESTNGLRSAITEVDARLAESWQALAVLKDSGQSLGTAIASVSQRFGALSTEAAAVSEAGKANDAALRQLSVSLSHAEDDIEELPAGH